MSQFLAKFGKIAPVAIGASMLMAPGAIANELSPEQDLLQQINQYNDGVAGDSLSQVGSVFDLRDVSPSDWAFDALRSLVERYGCIQGYPNQTFQGNKAMTRYEFAAGLNACLDSLSRIAGNGMEQGDLAQLQRLVDEFEAELATLGARVDDLEARTEFLEDHQFSTTTKLGGEVIFSLYDAFGTEPADGVAGDSGSLTDQLALSNRVRLNLDTTFTGRDRLRTRLESGNFGDLEDAVGNNVDMARLGHDTNSGNAGVEIGKLFYRTPVGDKATFYVGTVALGIDDILSVHNPNFESSGTGALSRFGRFNPLTFRGPDGTGVGLTYDFSDKFDVALAYVAADGGNTTQGAGLFNGPYSLAGQVNFSPIDTLDVGFTYVNKYHGTDNVALTGNTGSDQGRFAFDGSPTSSDNFGIDFNWSASETFDFGGWIGYTDATNEAAAGDAEYWTWATNLAIHDFGGEDNMLGVIFGQTPRLGGNIAAANADPDNNLQLEVLYKYKLNDNITITPGTYVIFTPDNNNNNDTIWVGALRTTFKF